MIVALTEILSDAPHMRISFRGRTLTDRSRPCVVAVLNITPDSYGPESRATSVEAVIARAHACLQEGTDILELGAESTGPGSLDVAEDIEMQRLLPSLCAVRQAFPQAWISVDTWKATVAEEALRHGADIVNDVTAGRGDSRMFDVMAKARCPCILMYRADRYEDIMSSIRRFLIDRISVAESAGVVRNRIIIDPGLGHFLSSDPACSFEVLDRLDELVDLAPILVSPSRKSFLAWPTNLPVAERLPATLAATALAMMRGTSFVRTHDVQDTVRVFRSCGAIRRSVGRSTRARS
jgi:dihydropteroate synthase